MEGPSVPAYARAGVQVSAEPKELNPHGVTSRDQPLQAPLEDDPMSGKHRISFHLSAALLLIALPLDARTADREDDVRGLDVSSSPDRHLHRPIVIDQPGKYVLRRDLHAQDVAIVIRASQVTLDLDGHALSGPGGKGVGIRIEDSSGVAVHDGSIGWFGTGVEVLRSRNVSVKHLRIVGEDRGGTPPNVEIGVMIVNSRGVVIQDNVIVDTFLGVFVRGGGSAGNRIAGNVLTAGQNGAIGICYNPAMNEGAAGPRGDLVYGNHVARFQTGISLSAESVANIIRENDIAYLMQAISEASPNSNVLLENASVQTFL
jgi:Periplasmic copper-binding protein (NosD)